MDKVIKTYRGGRDPERLEQLGRRHEAYVDCLTKAGMRVPETRFLILNHAGHVQPVIVQAAFDDAFLLHRQIEAAKLDEAIMLLERAAMTIVSFWKNVAQRPERIGVHPSVHSFAMDADGPIYVDTFLPLIGYSRDEMGRMVLRFSESGMVRAFGPVAPERIRAAQDTWYSPAGTVVGLIESAIRLRPHDREPILAWARAFATTQLDGDTREGVLGQMKTPRRLPDMWTATRRVLGLEAKPNV